MSWTVTKYPDTKSHTIYTLAPKGNGYITIASVKHPDPATQAAIAHKMGAAGELFAAVEELLDVGDWVTMRPKEGRSTLAMLNGWDKLRAAMKKARGE